MRQSHGPDAGYTLWFQEWRGRLVARPEMRPELRLHVARDALYVVIFASLPFVA